MYVFTLCPLWAVCYLLLLSNSGGMPTFERLGALRDLRMKPPRHPKTPFSSIFH